MNFFVRKIVFTYAFFFVYKAGNVYEKLKSSEWSRIRELNTVMHSSSVTSIASMHLVSISTCFNWDQLPTTRHVTNERGSELNAGGQRAGICGGSYFLFSSACFSLKLPPRFYHEIARNRLAGDYKERRCRREESMFRRCFREA